MAAIDYLRQRGFSVRVAGQRLIVSPASKLTKDLRQHIKLHRLELIAEAVANDGETRRSSWTVALADGRRFSMITTHPITHAEALADIRGRGCWPDADILEN